MILHIFNPDTDYALASGLNFYTPPAKIKAMRAQMALLPARWALPGEAILLLDRPPVSIDALPDYLTARDKHLKIFHPEEPLGDIPDLYPAPWGWNPALRQHLLSLGIPEANLPSYETISRLRTLSHRRTASLFNAHMGSSYIATELTSIEEVAQYTSENPGAWLKAPWSSSGRGIINCADLEPRHILPWAKGIIRRQGAVMAETPADRILDFATEWTCTGGKTVFEGLSVFQTSSRGKYHGNILLDQPELEALIKKAAPTWNGEIIESQKEALEALIAPHYTGPLGIDMIAERSGVIRPCIELNLRMTMGLATLKSRTDKWCL